MKLGKDLVIKDNVPWTILQLFKNQLDETEMLAYVIEEEILEPILYFLRNNRIHHDLIKEKLGKIE